ISQVPLLGDLPITGNAFKRRRNTGAKTELLIFLTPHAAAEPDILQPMSQEELDGTKLAPDALGPARFDQHLQAQRRGDPTRPPPPSLDEVGIEPVVPMDEDTE